MNKIGKVSVFGDNIRPNISLIVTPSEYLLKSKWNPKVTKDLVGIIIEVSTVHCKVQWNNGLISSCLCGSVHHLNSYGIKGVENNISNLISNLDKLEEYYGK